MENNTVGIIWQIVAGIFASVGGAGFIIYKLSGFLGKQWADRAFEKYKQELKLEYEDKLIQQNRRRKLYEDLSESIENIFAGKQEEISLKLNKLFGLLALYAPDDVYASLKKSLDGKVIPNEVKPIIYSALRKDLFGRDTKLKEEDLIKHMEAKPLK